METTYKKTFPYVPLGYFFATIVYFSLMIWGAQVSLNLWGMAGIFLTLLAYIPWIAARYELGNSLTVAPEAKKLVTTGIYSKIQHPMYISQILVLCGFALFLQSWIFGLVAVLGYGALSIYRGMEEHKVLKNAFGSSYEEYASKTWF